jgi:capsular exopolysaccharide synthesis family protein
MNDQANAPHGNQKNSGQLIPATQAVPVVSDPYGPLALYPGASGVDAPLLFGLSLHDCWRILNKRKWLILGIAAAFVTLSAVRTLMETPLYTATVRLQIERAARIIESGNVMPEAPDYEFMETQYELLRSQMMAERVASTLKLGGDEDLFKPKGFSIFGTLKRLFQEPSPPSTKKIDTGAAGGAIVGRVVVTPVTGSRLVDVSYSDPDPARAQAVANAYGDAFVATNIDKRFQANAAAKTFLEDKIQQLRVRLEDSEKKVLAFAEQQQIVDVEDKSSIAETNLAEANTALGTLISERTRNEQLWRQLEKSGGVNLPQLLTNSVIEKLRGQRNELSLEYEEKLETYKPDYPQMVQIRNKLKEIDQQLASEVQTTKESLKAAYEASLSQEEEVSKRVQTLKEEVLDLQKRSIQYNILKREVDTNRELYASLLQRYKEVDIAGGVGANNVFVVDKAGLPGAPSSPRLSRALMLALGLGLGAGLAAAYLLERLDDRIRSPEQVELISGLTTLGIIPKVDDVQEGLADRRSAIAEAYRSLCTALLFSTENGLPSSLSITSAGPGEGKSFTSISIAKHFATIGRRVLLIDADLRNPSLHIKLDGDNSIGLSNCLTGACTPPDAMQTTDIASLAFMASGPLPPNAAELLGGSRLHSLLSVASEVFDLVVVDGPPVLGLADAPLLSSATASTVFVVGAGQVRTGQLRGALRQLQLSRAPLIGVVLTKYDAKTAGYGYGYSYGYGYGYGYGKEVDPRGLSVAVGSKSQPRLTDAHENV